MKKYFKAIFLFSIIVVSSSCNKWLDLEPENDLIRQEFWQKKADVDAVVAAMYDAFRETSLESLIWGELRADMVLFTGTEFADYLRIAFGDITSTNGKINWKEYYGAINLANTIMEFSGDVIDLDKAFTPPIKEAYDAEALFIRSMCYFYLVRLWKEVPLILSAASSDTVDIYKPKSTESQILNQLVTDLKYAETIAYSKENEWSAELFKGRANVYSIQTLLADIYLWMEKYNECIEYCDKVIKSGNYFLLNQNNWFQLYYPGNSRESIFEIQYNDAYVSEENPIYNYMLPVSGGRRVITTPALSDLFVPADIRQCGNNNVTWKYLGKSNTSSTSKRDLSERDANFIYYRYADILLMKAEALAETGNFGDAKILLNDIVLRAGLPTVNLPNSLSDYRQFILEERAREFALEGKRWFDVLRFAKKNNFENKYIIINILLERATDVKERPIFEARVRDTMSYYLPIPEGDLTYNQSLEQNPFYNR